jgi:hypothetical protein
VLRIQIWRPAGAQILPLPLQTGSRCSKHTACVRFSVYFDKLTPATIDIHTVALQNLIGGGFGLDSAVESTGSRSVALQRDEIDHNDT